MRTARLSLFATLLLAAGPLAAEDTVSESESKQYFFGLLQKGQTFSVERRAAGDYLRGVWRLDRRAHVGGGHYVEAERGDDVYLICNDTRMVQVDFNRDQRDFIEVVSELENLEVESDGSFSFGTHRQYKPLDDDHMAVTAYDYIAVLERASGRKVGQDEE